MTIGMGAAIFFLVGEGFKSFYCLKLSQKGLEPVLPARFEPDELMY